MSILQDLLNERGYPLKGTTIAVLGVAYKRNVDDPRESPFFNLRDLLLKKDVDLKIFDSWYYAGFLNLYPTPFIVSIRDERLPSFSLILRT